MVAGRRAVNLVHERRSRQVAAHATVDRSEGWSQFARATALGAVARGIRSRLLRASACGTVALDDEEFGAAGALLDVLSRLALEVLPDAASGCAAAARPVAGASADPVLIVCAPGCSSLTVVENVAGALAAGCDVAVAAFEEDSRLTRHVVELLAVQSPAGHFCAVGATGEWRLPWPRVTIAVLTPAAVFLNDRPWVRLARDPAGLPDLASLVDFYRERSALS
jgi:hypothetical protein